jgi:Glycosyl hydrolases family 43
MMLSLYLAVLTGLSLAATGSATNYAISASAATVTWSNDVRLQFDTDGNQVDAYGSKVNFFNGTYYLYGSAFAETGFSVSTKAYQSNDLVNWNYNGFICEEISNECGAGRPHIVYNAKTQKYVLWSNVGSVGYGIATSSQPNKNFVVQSAASIDPQFDGLQPADLGVEVLNGTGYIAFSTLNFRYEAAGSFWPPLNQSMYIAPLTADFTNVSLPSYPVRSEAFDLIDNEAESPDLFYRNGYYYVATSNTCGYCNGTIGLLFRSTSIKGPWTRQILSGYSCNGQVEGILPLVDPNTGTTTYVWHSTSVPGGPRVGFGGHIFQPLKFNSDGSAQDLDCSVQNVFKVPLTIGTGPKPSGKALAASDGSPAIANYQAVCDSDQYTVIQTWTASKSGTLKSVAINLAKAYQTAPLVVNVFKYSSDADLVQPGYKYTLLGTKSLAANTSDLTFVFNTATIPTNQSVVKGDKLGVSMGFGFFAQDFTPYCHLEYDTAKYSGGINGAPAPGKLFQQAQGQNSWRGANGKTSVVYERVGKGVKFFATVE